MATDTLAPHGARASRSVPGTAAAPGAAYTRAFFVMQAIGIFFLQKIGIPVGGGGSGQFIMVWLYAGLILLVLSGRLKVDPVKLGLFTATLASIVLATLLTGRPVSVPALLLVLILYLPFIFTVFVSRDEYVGYLKFYQSLMVIMAVFVVLQMVLQTIWSAAAWPNLEKILPQSLIFPNFNYMNSMSYGSPLFKPNAIFLLEPSFVSQFAMIAMLIELLYFRRLWALVMFGLAQMLSFSGSGLLIFALASPFLLPRLSPRIFLGGAVALLILGGVAGSVGWFDTIGKRVGEFSEAGTSGRYRYVDPLIVMAKTAEDPKSIVTGWGAGATREDTMAIISLTFTKIFTEYGLITFLIFYTFAIRSVFWGTPNKILAWMMFLYYNLGSGGFTLPIMIIPMFLLVVLFRINTPTNNGREYRTAG